MIGPFKGISERPYDQAILADTNWQLIAAEVMPFTHITLTQTHLNIQGIFGKQYSGDPFPRIVQWDGEYYLEDGHHRLVLQAVLDRTYTAGWCRVRRDNG